MTVSRIWQQILLPTNVLILLLINMHVTFDPWQSEIHAGIESTVKSMDRGPV